MIDWRKSYTARWRVFRVNRKTWEDAGKIDNVDSISVTNTADGDQLQSGSMDVTGDFESDYYRIVLTAEQDGDVERVDVATLLFDVTDGEHDYGIKTQSADGFSVLHPAETTKIITGSYAPANVNGAKYAGELLQSAINAPVVVEGSFTLNNHVVFDVGSSVLECVWSVLDAGPDGGYVIQIDGRGIVYIRPMPKMPTLTLDSSNARLLSNGIKYTRKMSEIPNRYIVNDDGYTTVIVNDDPDSPISTVNRGYYVDEVDEAPTLVNGETYAAYGKRMLKAASILTDEREYTREYAPDVNLFNIVRASLPGLEGDMRVIEQSISCDYGIVIEEKANREIQLWQ